MQLSFLSYSLSFLVLLLIVVECENEQTFEDIREKESHKFSHNVLDDGRIISKPVIHPVPVDQMQLPDLQLDGNTKDNKKYVAHGDILIPIEELEQTNSKRSKRKIVAETNRYGTSNRWPRAVVPYEFISGIDYRVQQNVLTAMQHWHQRTCIRFEPYDSQRHWDINAKITIEDTGSGCATFVGYRPSSSGYLSSYSVYLPMQCPLGSAIHELGHVIGFYHEMARTDRDLEIRLYFSLMSSSEATQYDIMPNPMPGYYGQPYDLGSIMHYYPTDVMEARDSRRQFLMGQRTGLSFLDSKLANLGYHCADVCDSQPECVNEGYINQQCKCSCPEGFYGTKCNLLQGYLDTDRVLSSKPATTTTTTPIPSEPEPSEPEVVETTSTTTTTTAATPGKFQFVFFYSIFIKSYFFNYCESCGSGVRVRTRLCSDTNIHSSANPCASIGGDSFEIEACQNPECNQADIILSCTFDLANEKCPLKSTHDWKIQRGIQADQSRPINDHTRGDGKYLVLIEHRNHSKNGQSFELGSSVHSQSSIKNNHCLQFWYSVHGRAVGKLKIIKNNEEDTVIIFNEKDQNVNWKQVQQTILDDADYQVIFEYQSATSEYNYIAFDDISIINGTCTPTKSDKENRRRKRRQTDRGCSRVIDLTRSNSEATISSPNYPSLYPSNSECYYYIRGPKSYHVNIQFTDFNVPNSNSNNCDDTVEIRYYHIGQPGPKYCGSGANSNNLRFVSTKGAMLVVFRSNGYYNGRGFSAQASLSY
ncbi:unnamed protein product [Adineta steineri]|uniref:Metalloendopeptidase n=1 Tax=Adineta steineri TaxID=433720 RepID=A0A819XMF5_9BILA|nr:unnamed protein product [Adineta steineri]CAF4138948.1 unnamed protein product [Adineta steineri]